jgi:hypothetical protein
LDILPSFAGYVWNLLGMGWAIFFIREMGRLHPHELDGPPQERQGRDVGGSLETGLHDGPEVFNCIEIREFLSQSMTLIFFSFSRPSPFCWWGTGHCLEELSGSKILSIYGNSFFSRTFI